MSFNVDTIQIENDLAQLLKNNLLAINVNVTNKISSINKITNIFYPANYPFNAPDLPQLSVYYTGKPNEEFNAIGAGGRKKALYSFKISGITRLVKNSKLDSRYRREVVYMANNIDEILRNNIEFSSQIILSNPQHHSLIFNEKNPTTYVIGFETEVICECDVINC